MLAEFSIHRFEYAARVASFHPLRRIPNYNDVADSLWTFLSHELADYPRLVLVSHSQGGLVVQRMLARTLADGRGQELARIRRIVMFACPNSGSELALEWRRRVWFWFNPQERDLRPLSEAVTEAQRTVLRQIVHATSVSADRCPIPIAVYAGESDGIVTPTAARHVFPDVGVLPGDHFSIIQPDASTHRSYTTLRSDLLAALSDVDTYQPPAGPPLQPPEPEPAVSPPRTRSASDRRLIIEQLLAVPGISEPAFRQLMYNQLPNPIVNQLSRHGGTRLELAALVTSFDHYPDLDPWHALADALNVLAPDAQAVRALIRTLAEQGLIERRTVSDR
jgi:hypothetical protein